MRYYGTRMDPSLNITGEDRTYGKEPPKYIRTFAQDMEILKKGGVPSITHVARPGETLQGPLQLGNDDAAAPRAKEEQFVVKEAAPLKPMVAARTFPLADVPNVPAVSSPKPLSSPLVPPTPKPPPPPKIAEKIEPLPTISVAAPTSEKPRVVSPIHTYVGDFAERMKQTNASRTSILAAEQDRKDRPPPEPVQPAQKKGMSPWLFIVPGMLLLIGGAGGLVYAYLQNSKPSDTTMHVPRTARIFADQYTPVSGVGLTLTQSILSTMQQKSLGEHRVRVLTLSGTSTSQGVFNALNLPAPGLLKRNIKDSDSMAGVMTDNGIQTVFFILSVTSYRDTFAGMLSWEKKMPYDLGLLYPSAPVVPSASIDASSTPPTGFKDVVVANHDARAYVDSLGQTTLIYGYWDQKTLLIARNESVFAELINRLASAR